MAAELVAVVGGEVVGHVGVATAGSTRGSELVDVAVLSPLSTLPDHQGGGIGTALVAAAVGAAARLGRPALFLEGGPAFYGAAASSGPASTDSSRRRGARPRRRSRWCGSTAYGRLDDRAPGLPGRLVAARRRPGCATPTSRSSRTFAREHPSG